MKKRAFIIGANGADLRYAESDAQRVAEVLKANEYEVELILKEKEIALGKQLNGTDAIEIHFNRFCGRSVSEETILFYYAGHGTIKNNSLHLILNSTELSFNKITSALDDTSCSAENKLIFLDCCRAGRATVKLNSLGYRNKNIVAIVAASEYDPAYELEEEKAGFFSYYVYKALKNGIPNFNTGEPEITVTPGGLVEYLDEQRKRFSRERNIDLPKINYYNHSKNTFPIVRIKKTDEYRIEEYIQKNEILRKEWVDLERKLESGRISEVEELDIEKRQKHILNEIQINRENIRLLRQRKARCLKERAMDPIQEMEERILANLKELITKAIGELPPKYENIELSASDDRQKIIHETKISEQIAEEFQEERKWWKTLPHIWQCYFEKEYSRKNKVEEFTLVEIIDLMGELETIDLRGLEVETIEPISRLKNIKEVILDHTPVISLSPLMALDQVKVLRCNGLTKLDINTIRELRKLEGLFVDQTDIRNLEFVSDLSALQYLSCNDTHVKDLFPLSRLSNLRKLELRKTRIENLKILRELPGLEFLDVTDTRLTQFEIALFKHHHPKCVVKY